MYYKILTIEREEKALTNFFCKWKCGRGLGRLRGRWENIFQFLNLYI
jgi:hypothetical protein